MHLRRVAMAAVLALATAAGPSLPAVAPARTSAAAPETTAGLATFALPFLEQGARVFENVLRVLRAVGFDDVPRPAPSSIDLGADGRLTVVLLGSDWTPTRFHDYIDIVLVMTINPRTREVAAVQIPRYAVSFPRSPANGGGIYTGLMSRLYGSYSNKPPRLVDRGALAAVKRDVAHILGVEIDYYAYTRFTGFARMVSELGGIRVRVGASIYDPYFVAFFPAGRTELDGSMTCPPVTRACSSALKYVRSRKGSVGGLRNEDRLRNFRQQEVVLAAIRRVIRGKDLDLAQIVARAAEEVVTDMPNGMGDAWYLISLLRGARFGANRRIVFDDVAGYASKHPQATGERTMIVLHVDAIRRLCDIWFAPVS